MLRFGGPEKCEYYHTAKESQGTVRTDSLYVFGVDFMSSDQVMAYFEVFYPVEVEWLNDSSCNVKFPSPEVALLAYNTNAVSRKVETLEGFGNELTQAFGYQHDGKSIPLQIRFATEKVKAR